MLIYIDKSESEVFIVVILKILSTIEKYVYNSYNTFFFYIYTYLFLFIYANQLLLEIVHWL